MHATFLSLAAVAITLVEGEYIVKSPRYLMLTQILASTSHHSKRVQCPGNHQIGVNIVLWITLNSQSFQSLQRGLLCLVRRMACLLLVWDYLLIHDSSLGP